MAQFVCTQASISVCKDKRLQGKNSIKIDIYAVCITVSCSNLHVLAHLLKTEKSNSSIRESYYANWA